MATTNPQTIAQPGSAFTVPGVPGGQTQWFDEYEDTYQLAGTVPESAAKPVLGIQKFRQTDVVTRWMLELYITQKLTKHGTTPTKAASAYAPWNYIGTLSVLVQNQYSAVSVESGIDLYIANLMRPYAKTALHQILGANPQGFPAGGSATGYPAVANAQPNLDWAAQWTTGVTVATKLALDIGPAVWFDSYYDLSITGSPLSPPHSALVSPQYMAGTPRVITPKVQLNQNLSTTTTDIAPIWASAVGTTKAYSSASTYTLSLRREGVYAGNPAVNPVVYAWQHRVQTNRYNTMAGASRGRIQIPLDTGQLMGSWVRMFAPKATSTKGAPLGLTKITSITFQYGSGLLRFQGTPAEIQRRWVAQHGTLLPKGVVALDFATNERGQVTNHRLPNTLTTGGIQWVFKFKTARTASFYATLGTESLVYVT